MFIKVDGRIINTERINYIHMFDGGIFGPKYPYVLVIKFDNDELVLGYNTEEEANEALKKLVGDIHD